MRARNWVEISRSALRHNLRYVRGRLAPGTEVCAVVKADAYGHGALACARVFVEEGVSWLAVTSADEGMRLRQAGIPGRILVLAGFGRNQADELIEHRLTPAIWDAEQIAWLAPALARQPQATPFPIHLKLETGMGRLGILPAQEGEIAAAVQAAPGLQVEAVFSHLAASEAPDEGGNLAQQARFQAAVARFSNPRWHLLNSEAALRYPDWGGMLVRSGLALYGYSAQPHHAAHLVPALTWKTHVLAIKDLPAGHGVGYGPHFRTAEPMRIATIAAGYADGYRRDFYPGAEVWIAGQAAPVVGSISMDLTTVDVSRHPALRLGEEVVLLGPQVSAPRLAELAHTLPYEILCGLAARVERTYFE